MADFKETHFAVLDVQGIPLDDAYQITAVTDVPCHLYCRMTWTPPRKHSTPSYRRGLFLTGDIRFCFVVYEDNEQLEAGDTYIHTWIKDAWPVCQTRWFYFVGEIAGAPVVSETAIFEFHYPDKPPPPVYTSIILEVTDDGSETSIRDEWLHTPPGHWDKVRTADAIWDPTWGLHGFHYPNYVFEKWEYNDDFYRDLYTLENPPFFTQPVTRLTLHGRLGRNKYPHGKYKFSLRTHGLTYDTDEVSLRVGLEWESHDFPLNPFTSKPWSRQEVKDLEIGIVLGKELSVGRAVCDKLYAQLVLG